MGRHSGNAFQRSELPRCPFPALCRRTPLHSLIAGIQRLSWVDLGMGPGLLHKFPLVRTRLQLPAAKPKKNPPKGEAGVPERTKATAPHSNRKREERPGHSWAFLDARGACFLFLGAIWAPRFGNRISRRVRAKP